MIYLNGEFIPKNEAVISPEDRGFNFADGIYEVIKYYGGKPFRYADHLDRLKRSLHEVQINFEGCDELEPVFQELLEKNGLAGQEAGVYLQISRGSQTRIHRFPEGIEPTVYATVFPFASKWDQLRNGMVTEGSHSSFLAVKNAMVHTHPDSNLILPGITKKVVFEICQANNIRVIEKGIPATELAGMDEMMIVGTGSEVTPVVQIDEKPVGNGQPGSLTRLIQDKFFERTRITK